MRYLRVFVVIIAFEGGAHTVLAWCTTAGVGKQYRCCLAPPPPLGTAGYTAILLYSMDGTKVCIALVALLAATAQANTPPVPHARAVQLPAHGLQARPVYAGPTVMQRMPPRYATEDELEELQEAQEAEAVSQDAKKKRTAGTDKANKAAFKKHKEYKRNEAGKPDAQEAEKHKKDIAKAKKRRDQDDDDMPDGGSAAAAAEAEAEDLYPSEVTVTFGAAMNPATAFNMMLVGLAATVASGVTYLVRQAQVHAQAALSRESQLQLQYLAVESI